METDVRKLEQMIVEANRRQSQYDSRERFGMFCEEYGITKPTHAEFDTEQEIYDKTRLARKTDLSVVCRTHFELNLLIKEYGKIFEDTPIVEGKWKFTLNELKEINIDELLKLHIHDTYWVIDFLKSTYNTIVDDLKKNCGYRYADNKLVQEFNNKKSYIVKEISNVLNLNVENEIHQNLIKVLERIYDHLKEYNTIDEQHEVLNTERDLKKELLEEDIEVLKSNLGVDDDLCYEAIDDLLEYHIYHYSDFEQAREILTSVCDLLSYGYSLQEVTELTPDSDWVSIIDDFLCGEGNCPDIKSIEGFVDIFDMEYITNECKKEIVSEDRKNSGSKGGKKSKTNHSKAITIKNKITGKEICFNSAEECAKYLNVSKRGMVRFKQGDTKLNRTWEIISQPIDY